MLSTYIIIIEGLCSLQLYIVYIWIMFDYYYLRRDMLYMSKLNFSPSVYYETHTAVAYLNKTWNFQRQWTRPWEVKNSRVVGPHFYIYMYLVI